MQEQILLSENELKVLHQITLLKYINPYPFVDINFVAIETGLNSEQVEEAINSLNNNPARILRKFDKKGNEITVNITDRTYNIAKLFQK